MDIKIYKSETRGHVAIPASKSLLHRALICASLAKGKSIIRNIYLNDDVNATIDCLRNLGAKVIVNDDIIEVFGIKEFEKVNNPLNVNASASTLRFLLGICTLFKNKILIEGQKRVFQRNNEAIVPIFKKNQCEIILNENNIEIIGEIKSGEYIIDGSMSSQFISGLLFLFPLLKGNSKLTVKEPFVSQGYVDMTIQVMKEFNIKIKKDNNVFYIDGNQEYIPCHYVCEGDYSQLSFFSSLALLNGNIICENINKESIQPDRKLIDILKESNCEFTSLTNGYVFNKSFYKLPEIDITNNPDLGPILMILSLFSCNETKIMGINRLINKESNRKEVMINILLKCGALIEEYEDYIIVKPRKLNISGKFDSFNDHRILMSLVVLGTMSDDYIAVQNIECVKKSYPTFFDDIKKVNVKYEFID